MLRTHRTRERVSWPTPPARALQFGALHPRCRGTRPPHGPTQRGNVGSPDGQRSEPIGTAPSPEERSRKTPRSLPPPGPHTGLIALLTSRSNHILAGTKWPDSLPRVNTRRIMRKRQAVFDQRMRSSALRTNNYGAPNALSTIRGCPTRNATIERLAPGISREASVALSTQRTSVIAQSRECATPPM